MGRIFKARRRAKHWQSGAIRAGCECNEGSPGRRCRPGPPREHSNIWPAAALLAACDQRFYKHWRESGTKPGTQMFTADFQPRKTTLLYFLAPCCRLFSSSLTELFRNALQLNAAVLRRRPLDCALPAILEKSEPGARLHSDVKRKIKTTTVWCSNLQPPTPPLRRLTPTHPLICVCLTDTKSFPLSGDFLFVLKGPERTGCEAGCKSSAHARRRTWKLFCLH